MRTVHKYLCSLALCMAAGAFVCCDGGNTDVVTPNTDLSGLFENNKGIESDFESGIIEVPAGLDSLVIEDVSSLGGAQCYLSLDNDLVDPEIDWDSPVEDGTVLDLTHSDFVNIVVLDDESRIVKVWQIVQRKGKSSSSEKSSSSSEKASSSSKEKSSSSDKPKSSSSEASSSSEDAPESSAEESSSSEEPASSSEEVESSSSDASESSSSEEASSSSTVVEVQLPGSDFNSRKDFWATTSDAMGTKETSAAITVSSEANLEFDGGMATITTREVEGSFVLIDGSWKMAGGFYFSGEYAGETALDIYHQGYTSGTPSTDCSDISKDMTFGKPFTARPTAFTVKYSYNHVANKSTDYPQKNLVYVMLVGKGGKVVATGAFSDNESVEMTTRTVKLSYGKDPFGLLSGEYPVAEGLTLGKGDEDVTAIHVMFASSAYAHIVCGGTLLEGAAKKYRGGENSALVLDDFKLEYQEE